jgi:4'-phosphopantetheinyl transferase
MLTMHGQSSLDADCAAQLWFAAAMSGSNAAGSGTSRETRRGLERAASRALLAKTGEPEMPRRSLTHSGGCAAIAIAPAGCVAGIDIEATQPRDVHRIAQFAFAPDEVLQLRSLAVPEATARFYVLWTLKEAFTKALGLPLLAAARACSFGCFDDRWTADVPAVTPWRAIVFAPRPALTLAAVIMGPRNTRREDWICRELPGAEVESWRCLARLSSDDY